MPRILVVDDEPLIANSLAEIIRSEIKENLQVSCCYSSAEALAEHELMPADIMVTDVKMPGMDGLELFQRVRSKWPDSYVIFLTGYEDFRPLYQVSKYSNVRYLLKSEGPDVIVEGICKVLLTVRQRKRLPGKRTAMTAATASANDGKALEIPMMTLIQLLDIALTQHHPREYSAYFSMFSDGLSAASDTDFALAAKYYTQLLSVLKGYAVHCGYENLVLINQQCKTQGCSASTSLQSISDQIFALKAEECSRLYGNLFLQINQYISQNFSADLSLMKLSQYTHFNPCYLSHIYKENFHESLAEHVTEMRIAEARYLLLCTDLNVQNVCQRTSDYSPTNFARQFKKATGHTPQQYRKQYGLPADSNLSIDHVFEP